MFSDFLGYLLRCTQAYIRDHHPQGFWESLEGNIDYVLSHPNGWEGSEQSLMRQAAVLAGLVQNVSESSIEASSGGKLTFVSEGEASLHFAIEHGILGDTLGEGEGVIVVDAGGGTVDISTYTRRVSDGATRFEESSVSQCASSIEPTVQIFTDHLTRLFPRLCLCIASREALFAMWVFS